VLHEEALSGEGGEGMSSKDRFEPNTMNDAPAELCLLASIAVSLKRIADVLELREAKRPDAPEAYRPAPSPR
jgi:hypothetical protein